MPAVANENQKLKCLVFQAEGWAVWPAAAGFLKRRKNDLGTGKVISNGKGYFRPD